MKYCKIGLVVLLCLCGVGMQAQGATLESWDFGATSLPMAQPDYDWWYGCSPTSAGMLMGHYDINGYDGLSYDNLMPGGTAEAETFTSPDSAGSPTKYANIAIASAGHISDFWTGYGNSGDDPNPGTTRSFDCLADFMGTSQDSGANSDGGTTFYYYNDGSRLYASEMPGYGIQDDSGMYGIGEYVQYAGYDYEASTSQLSTGLYNQYADSRGLANGFSFAEYMAEIDAGRGVLIHVVGHTMYGYGYDTANGNEILLHDTWNLGEHRMTWGGAYSGMDLVGVTCLTLINGTTPVDPTVPEPASMMVWALIGGLGAGATCLRRRRQG